MSSAAKVIEAGVHHAIESLIVVVCQLFLTLIGVLWYIVSFLVCLFTMTVLPLVIIVFVVWLPAEQDRQDRITAAHVTMETGPWNFSVSAGHLQQAVDLQLCNSEQFPPPACVRDSITRHVASAINHSMKVRSDSSFRAEHEEVNAYLDTIIPAAEGMLCALYSGNHMGYLKAGATIGDWINLHCDPEEDYQLLSFR